MKIVILFFSLLLVNALCAQDSLKSKPGLLIRKWTGWRLNDHKLSSAELKATLYAIPEAVPYHKRYTTRKIVGISFLAPTFAFILLGRNNSRIVSNSYGRQLSGYTIGAFLCAGGFFYFTLSSQKQLKRAAEIYNRRIIY